MRVNVANLSWRNARITDRVFHCQRSTCAILRRRRHVISIATHTKANDFSIHFRAAFFRVFVLFQHEHARTVTQYETVTVFIPRTACRLRIIVTGRERTRCTKTTDTQRGTGFFCTTRNHSICIAVRNHARGLADVMYARRTSSRD